MTNAIYPILFLYNVNSYHINIQSLHNLQLNHLKKERLSTLRGTRSKFAVLLLTFVTSVIVLGFVEQSSPPLAAYAISDNKQGDSAAKTSTTTPHAVIDARMPISSSTSMSSNTIIQNSTQQAINVDSSKDKIKVNLKGGTQIDKLIINNTKNISQINDQFIVQQAGSSSSGATTSNNVIDQTAVQSAANIYSSKTHIFVKIKKGAKVGDLTINDILNIYQLNNQLTGQVASIDVCGASSTTNYIDQSLTQSALNSANIKHKIKVLVQKGAEVGNVIVNYANNVTQLNNQVGIQGASIGTDNNNNSSSSCTADQPSSSSSSSAPTSTSNYTIQTLQQDANNVNVDKTSIDIHYAGKK